MPTIARVSNNFRWSPSNDWLGGVAGVKLNLDGARRSTNVQRGSSYIPVVSDIRGIYNHYRKPVALPAGAASIKTIKSHTSQ